MRWALRDLGSRRDRCTAAERLGRAGRGCGHTIAVLVLLALGAGALADGVWLPVKAGLAQRLLERAWVETRRGGRDVKPWPWADTWPIARLTLPHGESLIVLADASGRSLAFAPGWLAGSARPGERGVGVIAAHRDTHFRALAALAVGERFELERSDGAVLLYEITAIDVVDAAYEDLSLASDQSLVALVTCYPFDAVVPGGTRRYVVWGRRLVAA
jgi:sortase A